MLHAGKQPLLSQSSAHTRPCSFGLATLCPFARCPRMVCGQGLMGQGLLQTFSMISIILNYCLVSAGFGRPARGICLEERVQWTFRAALWSSPITLSSSCYVCAPCWVERETEEYEALPQGTAVAWGRPAGRKSLILIWKGL